MSNSRKQILDQINKKAKKINELRTNSSRKMSVEEVIFKFFKDMEDIYIAAIDNVTFQAMLDTTSNLMYSRMRSFDNGVNVELVWNNAQTWQDLRLEGVLIKWSNIFLKNNPDSTKESYIDIANILLNF